MVVILALILVIVLAFGGYLFSGGSLAVMMHALPFELTMVMGMAILAFLVANPFAVIKRALRSIGKAVKGPKWKPTDYTDLLALLYELARAFKHGGPSALEPHIEQYQSSAIFNRHPRIKADHEATELIVDTFRLVMMQMDDPMEAEDIINRKIEAHHEHSHAPAHALAGMSDGLPAIGIVAAVLGVIKTMGSIDKPPEILGGMIGGALVGTFLGVFIAYCMVAPLSTRITQIEEQDGTFGHVIRDVLVAILKGHPPPVCVEIGRGNIPPDFRPGFDQVESQIKAL